MSHHHPHQSTLHRSQEQQFRRIALTRKGKTWLKRLLIALAVILALAVALSYVFVTRDTEPGKQLEIQDKTLPWSKF